MADTRSNLILASAERIGKIIEEIENEAVETRRREDRLFNAISELAKELRVLKLVLVAKTDGAG